MVALKNRSAALTLLYEIDYLNLFQFCSQSNCLSLSSFWLYSRFGVATAVLCISWNFVFTVGCPSCLQPFLRRENWSPVFHIKMGRPVKHLARGHNKRTCRIGFNLSLNAERPAGKLWIPFFKVFMYDSKKGIKA